MKDNSRKNHFFMVLLMILWTFDAVGVAAAVEDNSAIFIIFLKTLFSLPVLAITARLAKESLAFPLKKDIPKFFLSALLGNVLYFYFEYESYNYLPLGLVDVCLGTVPLFSYLVDCVVHKKKPKLNILVLIVISICGLSIAVGSSSGTVNPIGYLYCGLTVIIWILYGYVLNWIGDDYETITLTFYESCASVILMLPLAFLLRPGEPLDYGTFINIVIMGVVMNGFGYILENNAILTLGTTVSGLYINMLPFFTAAAGFIFFGQTLTTQQIIGSVIVVVCGFAVILLMGKYEKEDEMSEDSLDDINVSEE